MKKTIAILLVLVIGMVGVWAVDDALLFVKTTVLPINEMIILDNSEDKPVWATNDQTEAISNSSSESSTAATAASIVTSNVKPQTVGYLHTRTNNYAGVVVKVSATELKSYDFDNSTYTNIDTIDYIVSGGENTFDTSSEDSSAVTYLTISQAAGLRKGAVKTIFVQLEEDAPIKAAGDYLGEIVFNYIIQ